MLCSWTVTPASFVGFVCLFVFCFTSKVNSYGHGGTVSSPNHTFSWTSLNKQLSSTSCTYSRLYVTDNIPSWMIQRREQNDRINYFMINLHESMGPARDRTIGSAVRLASVARHITDCATRPGTAALTWIMFFFSYFDAYQADIPNRWNFAVYMNLHGYIYWLT